MKGNCVIKVTNKIDGRAGFVLIMQLVDFIPYDLFQPLIYKKALSHRALQKENCHTQTRPRINAGMGTYVSDLFTLGCPSTDHCSVICKFWEFELWAEIKSWVKSEYRTGLRTPLWCSSIQGQISWSDSL